MSIKDVAKRLLTRAYCGDRTQASSLGDAGSTTKPAENGLVVGRVAGQDLGYAGETGAEARARAGETSTSED